MVCSKKTTMSEVVQIALSKCGKTDLDYRRFVITPSIYLSILPFISLSILYLCIHPFIHLSIHPFIYLSIHPSIHLSIHSSIHSSIYLFILLLTSYAIALLDETHQPVKYLGPDDKVMSIKSFISPNAQFVLCIRTPEKSLLEVIATIKQNVSLCVH